MKWFQRKRNAKGFTMMELMVVVVIVGILAAIAIPLYGKYIKNSRVTEATSRIGELVTACKSYAQENQDATGNPTWPPVAGGGVVGALPSTSDLFSYSITAGAGANANTTALTITATGRGGRKMRGVTVAITLPNINSNGNPPVVTGL